jgi:hypothetical protein
MRVNVMRAAYHFEPKFRVTVLTREEWTTDTGTPPTVKWHVWYTDGSWMRREAGARVFGQSIKQRLSLSLRK